MNQINNRITAFHRRDSIAAFDTLMCRQTDALLVIDKIIKTMPLAEDVSELLQGVVAHIETAHMCAHECFGQFKGKRTYEELKQFLKDQEELEDERIYKTPKKKLTDEEREKTLQQVQDIIKSYKAQRNKRPKSKRENS